jgi:hypothetical protein
MKTMLSIVVLASLAAVLGLCMGVGHVSAGTGGAGQAAIEAAVGKAFALQGATFDLYACTQILHVGDVFEERGFDISDIEDGVITPDKIVITWPDGRVNTSEPYGVFRELYDAVDSTGLPAEQQVRRIVVLPRENPPVISLRGCDEF